MRYDLIEMCGHARAIIRHFGFGPSAAYGRFKCSGNFTVVCFTNRCGSTLVCSALSRLGLAGPPNRYLNYEFLNSDAIIETATGNRIGSFDEYIRYIIAHHASPKGHVTIKASIQQLNFLLESGILNRIDAKISIIFVRRRNVIAQAVSLWTALQDGCWTSLHNVLPHALPEYDELKILQHVKQIYESNAHFEMFFDYHGITPLQLHYEDFHNDESQLLVQLADYYRCDDPPTASALPIARQITRQKLDWERMLRSAGKSHVSDVLGRFVGSSS